MNIADMRALVRRDLRDDDPADPRWPDDELDAHIQHALRDLSRAAPLEAVSNVAAVAGSREVSLAPLRGLLDVEGVEFPVNLHPACFVPFSLWGGSLTLQVDASARPAATSSASSTRSSTPWTPRRPPSPPRWRTPSQWAPPPTPPSPSPATPPTA